MLRGYEPDHPRPFPSFYAVTNKGRGDPNGYEREQIKRKPYRCRKENKIGKLSELKIGASLFASNIGSEHFIGLAGSGAASGIAVVAFEWGMFTIPEYLSKRFGGYRLRMYLSLLALFIYIVTKISVDIYAGAVFVQQALGWNTYISIVALLAVTAVYTVVGGLAAVIFTDTLQTVIMLAGAISLSVMGFVKVGGITGLQSKYFEAVPETHLISNTSDVNHTASTCGLPRADAFHILRDPVNSDLPWPGVLIRSTFVSTWYWCADQVIVQRALAAKDIGHARGATLMAGYLKFLPLFLIIMPGMISRVLYPDSVACADAETCMEVCENPVGCSNVAYPRLILGLAPTGLRGLMMAVMMAALMSSLTSIFNSAATLFTMDLWRKIRKPSSERELLIVGKVFVLILVGISVAWIPLIQAAQQGQLFLYIQAVTGYLVPPICSVFLLAVFVPRVNEQGAFWGMVIGQIIGLTRMILDFVYPAPKCGEPDTRPLVVAKVHFTYFASMVLIITAAVVLVISYLTDVPSREQVYGLTFWTIDPVGPRPKRKRVPRVKVKDVLPEDFIEAELIAKNANEKKIMNADENSGNANLEQQYLEINGEEQDGGKTNVTEQTFEEKVSKRRSELDEAFHKILKKPETAPKTSLYDEIDIRKEDNETHWEMKESPVIMRQKQPERIPYDSDENRVLEVYGIGKRGSDKAEDLELEDLKPSQETVEQRNKIIRVKRSSYAADMSLVIHTELTKRKSIPPKVKPKPVREDSMINRNSEIQDEDVTDQRDSSENREHERDESDSTLHIQPPPAYHDMSERDGQSETGSEREDPVPESERNGIEMKQERKSDEIKQNPLYVPMEYAEVKRRLPSVKKVRAPPPPVNEKLFISSFINIFLNVNAILLLCVFVFLYCVFH
ncbi:hypothetical protein FSP39_010991 [Pinctada imbricata]|uniref:Sodium/myo-inositol cotransporter 2 n=1 Tax=Pinctada imbricata TaxID=66713 RepID=A0AA88YDN8_PINIB|nr:hypothetical protein FSP39_010991 [Pinctada imbricata]